MYKFISILLLLLIVTSTKVNSQGCMGGGSDDGVKVIGYIQPQYEYQFLDSGIAPMNGLSSNNSFSFNRARLGVTGNIPYDFSYYVMTELSPTKKGPYILDAYISYKRFAPYLNLSMGQFKMPFGLELTQGCHELYTINRAKVVNELASPFRDFGLYIFGSTGEKHLFGLSHKDIISWKLAITNGSGYNVMDDNEFKDFTGRIVIAPIDWIKIGGSFKYGEYTSIIVGDPDDTRMRYGFDLSIEKGKIILQGEYINGTDKGSTLVGGGCGTVATPVKGDFVKSGYFGQFIYKTKWNINPVLKYETYDPNLNDTVNKDALTDVTFGFSYNFNDYTRLQVNYVQRIEQGTEIKNNFIVTQLQVKF